MGIKNSAEISNLVRQRTGMGQKQP